MIEENPIELKVGHRYLFVRKEPPFAMAAVVVEMAAGYILLSSGWGWNRSDEYAVLAELPAEKRPKFQRPSHPRYCPLIRSVCRTDCGWFVSDDNQCAILALGEEGM